VAYFYYILLVLVVKFTLITVVNPGFGFSGLVSFLSILPGIYVFSRLSILFPAVAVEKKVGWDWALATSKHNGWRLVVIIGLLPLVFGSFSVFLYGRHLILDVLLAFIGTILTIFEIALLSLSFKYLSENTDTATDTVTVQAD